MVIHSLENTFDVPKNVNKIGQNSSALKSGKSTTYVSLDRKSPNLGFDTSSVKNGSRLTELLVLEDTTPRLAETRWFDIYLVNIRSG